MTPQIIKNSITKQFVKFLLVGAVNTLIGLSTIYLLKFYFSVDDAPANAIGYMVGIVVSFSLNKKITFHHKGEILKSFFRFISVLGVAYLANLSVVELAIEVCSINSYLSQALGIVPYTLIGYLGSRLIAFPDATQPRSEYSEGCSERP
ncbi:MAG TPA: GtrA family protein [Gammaproteobacteria bacterium]|nr:GtrA family protein [Gammaproteobacteria bacterium]